MFKTSFVKETLETPVGIVVRKHPRTGDFHIVSVRAGGLASQAELKPGMTLYTVNGISVKDMTLEQCIHVFKGAIGTVHVHAHPAPVIRQVRGQKPVPSSRVGLRLASDFDGAIYVKAVRSYCVLPEATVDMRVMRINGIEVDDMPPEHAAALLRNATNTVTMDVIDAYKPVL